MTVRALDGNGDIVTSGNHFIEEQLEIGQTITTRLKLIFGEYFRDTTDGTRLFEDILGKGNTNGVADAEIRRRISQTEGVNSIISYESNFDVETRAFSVSCQVLTVFGDVSIAEQFNG